MAQIPGAQLNHGFFLQVPGHALFSEAPVREAVPVRNGSEGVLCAVPSVQQSARVK